MKSKKKIFNDPIYGLLDYPHEIFYELIDHRYFQRLRRISQMGFTNLVYPGATNTRFHHALGALYLMTRAIWNLRSKGVEITEEEEVAVGVAILLHDIGHGPFSHALEGKLIPVHHEEISLKFMDILNEEFEGRLSLAIEIFKNKYKKPYLHELVSSQLDMDRMDYLIRDTYYTGVAEGVIGYDRIIKMLNVVDDHLVIEEKGIYSVEKFLIARRMMYWQVYLHKTSLSAERMLQALYARIEELVLSGEDVKLTEPIYYLLKDRLLDNNSDVSDSIMEEFAKCDDSDLLYIIKANVNHKDYFLAYICNCILNRRLFKVKMQDVPFEEKYIEEQTYKVQRHFNIDKVLARMLILDSVQSNQVYNSNSDEIKILINDGEVISLSALSNMNFNDGVMKKYFLYTPNIYY